MNEWIPARQYLTTAEIPYPSFIPKFTHSFILQTQTGHLLNAGTVLGPRKEEVSEFHLS